MKQDKLIEGKIAAVEDSRNMLPAPPMPSSPSKSSLNSKPLSPSKFQSSGRPILPSSPSKFSESAPSDSPSSSGRGLKALARRQQQMRQWDDDYSYHSTNLGSKVSNSSTKTHASSLYGQSKSSSCQTASSSVSSSVKCTQAVETNIACASKVEGTPRSVCSATRATISRYGKESSGDPTPVAPTPPAPGTPTYHYGQSPVLSPELKRDIEMQLHKPRLVSTDLDQASKNKVLPTSGSTSSSRDQSPVSKMFWDRKLISSLVSVTVLFICRHFLDRLHRYS